MMNATHRTRKTAMLGVLIASLAPIMARADAPGWFAFRADARGTGHVATDLGEQLCLWRVFENPLGWAPAVLTESVLFLAGRDHTVKAFDPIDGQQLWQAETGANIDVAPAYWQEKLYVASQDHYLYALNAATGKELWRLPLGSDAVAAPIVADATVFVGSELGAVGAVEATKGTVKWQVALGAAVVGLAAEGEALYVAVDDHRVCALSATDGRVLWEAELKDNPAPALCIEEGRLYAADLLGHLVCLDAGAGTPLWRSAGGVRLMRGSVPAVADGRVFVTTVAGDPAAFAASDGEVWATELGRPTTSSPVAGSTAVYYAHQGISSFSALSQEAQRWVPKATTPDSVRPRDEAPREIQSHLAVCGEIMAITTGTRCAVMVPLPDTGGPAVAMDGPPLPGLGLGGGGVPPHPTAVLDVYPLLPDGTALPRTNPPPPWKEIEVGDHTLVALDGRMSWDAFKDPLIQWEWREPLGNDPFVNRPFGIGGHNVYLIVWDEEGMKCRVPASHHTLVNPLPETVALIERQLEEMRRLKRGAGRSRR